MRQLSPHHRPFQTLLSRQSEKQKHRLCETRRRCHEIFLLSSSNTICQTLRSRGRKGREGLRRQGVEGSEGRRGGGGGGGVCVWGGEHTHLANGCMVSRNISNVFADGQRMVRFGYLGFPNEKKRKKSRKNSRKDTGFVQCGNREVGKKRRDDK